MSTYRKFSSRFAGERDKPKTFASFATFTGDIQNFEAGTGTDETQIESPNIRNAPAKVAQAAKVETSETAKIQRASVKVAQVAKVEGAVCVVCGAAGDLWHFGEALVHQECAAFLPKGETVEPSAAIYDAASAGPEGGCRVQIVELPAAGRYRKVFAHLQLKPPALIPVERWRQCVRDGSRFLAKWGDQAEALGWSSADLFGLHQPPDKPHPSYSRLSRYDQTGLIWLLDGRPVIALTESTAAIQSTTGNVTVYRRYNKPGLGPVGDSLEDFR